MYKVEGDSRLFQARCVKDLQPLTDIFCKKSGLRDEDWRGLMSYLWYGYFYTFANYERMHTISLWTALWGTSERRMLDFVRRKKSGERDWQGRCDLFEVGYVPIPKDNTMNELLADRLLKECGIIGLDYEVFVRKRGLFGNKVMSDSEIVRFLGIRRATLNKINKRNSMRLYAYKKENKEDL